MKSKLEVRMKRKDDVGQIEIYDSIGDSLFDEGLTAKSFAEKLKAMGDVKKIALRINSLGGSIFHGVSIYNQLRDHGATIDVSIDGFALSMASLIALAGDTRTIAANGFIMLHNPGGHVEGGAAEMRAAADLTDQLTEAMAATYAERTGLPLEEITSMMAAETWLSADEALAKGFATHKGKELKIAASFDPQQFRNMPDGIRAICSPTSGGTRSGDLKMEAATIAEIKAACPGASDKFVLTMAEKELPIEEIKSAYIVELNKAKGKKIGARAVEMSGSGIGHGDARSEWRNAVESYVAKGMSRSQASSRVNWENPGLHEQAVAEENAGLVVA